MKKYYIEPGWVTSKSDGDEHFISAARLMQIYNVKSEECQIAVMGSSPQEGQIILKPKYNGDYSV